MHCKQPLSTVLSSSEISGVKSTPLNQNYVYENALLQDSAYKWVSAWVVGLRIKHA